jgi:hypothetical protein
MNPGLAFLTFSLSAGIVVSYMILRSGWRGWPLVGALFVGVYGIGTVATQIDSVFFLSDKLPRGLIRALFWQGAITAALFAPLAVVLLGRWRTAGPLSEAPRAAKIGTSAVWRLALIVVAFVFLYMFFGYYVAWQSPALRQYYGGHEYANFFVALKANWTSQPSLYVLQVFRAMLYAACLFPLTRMLRASQWETALAVALFLSVWTTPLLLPNLTMPPSVALAHFRETLGFSLVFGALVGWLLYRANPADDRARGAIASSPLESSL